MAQPTLRVPKSMTGACLPFRVGADPYLGVVLKATFVLEPGPMSLASPEPIVRSDVHHNGSPARSVRVTPDLAPYLPLADVTFVGHAFAGPAGPSTEVQTRFSLFRYTQTGRQVVFDKRIAVRSATPFERMPMTWEKAYGGAGFPENPLGVGAGASAGTAPSLCAPDGSPLPVCFAPIAAAFPSRRNLVPDDVRRGLSGGEPVVPERLASGAGFPWGYFQSAPFDQRAQHLAGSEWLLLEGLHPALPSVEAQLPGARAAAAIFGLAADGVAEGTELPLRLDTVRVDGDALRVTLAWRGHFALPTAEARARAVIVGALSLRGEPYDVAGEGDVAQSAPRSRAFALPLVGTTDLDAVLADIEASAPPGSLAAPRSLAQHPGATTLGVEAPPAAPERPSVVPVVEGRPSESPLAQTFAVEAPSAPTKRGVEVPVVDAPKKG